jgi:hypothetical protein
MWAASHQILNEVANFEVTGTGRQFSIFPFLSHLDNRNIEGPPRAPPGAIFPHYADIVNLDTQGSLLVHLGSLQNTFGSSPSKLFSAVATSFFLDTGCLFTYLSIINATLKPGGVWVNYGPLQYHSHQLMAFTAGEVKELVTIFGFVILRWETTEPLEYVEEPDSLERKMYKSLFFSVRKQTTPGFPP